MKLKIDLKILFFLPLFYFSGQIKIYFIMMVFAFWHEMAHIITTIILRYRIQEFEIMPFGFFIDIKPDYIDYSKKVLRSNLVELKKIIIVFAGPLLNLILALCLSKRVYIYANILLLLNLIPIYPLDGGRILQSFFRIFFEKKKADKMINFIANFTVIFITICASILILYLKNIAILIILCYLWILVIRENKRFKIREKIRRCVELENTP